MLSSQKLKRKKFADEEPAEEATPAVAGDKKAPYQVLAVTACPTGIAHTYMAAESLEQHAAKKGISIKVETNAKAASSMPSRLKKSKGRKASSSLLISTFP